MKRIRAGFTLVEMLVVIAIILILMALVVVLVKHVLDRARYKHTIAVVYTLKSSCENYKTDNHEYPKVPYGTYTGSQALHFLLGREAKIVKSTGGSPTIITREPYFVFPSKWLQGNPSTGDPGTTPSFIVDAWGTDIQYYNPKPGAPATPLSFLVLSYGKDQANSTGDEIRSDKAEE